MIFDLQEKNYLLPVGCIHARSPPIPSLPPQFLLVGCRRSLRRDGRKKMRRSKLERRGGREGENVLWLASVSGIMPLSLSLRSSLSLSAALLSSPIAII